MPKHVGILTSGGDCPGLNAALRGFGRAAIQRYGMEVLGFLDGFRGVVRDRSVKLDLASLSGILTDGGTILGTSRDKPHKMPVGGKVLDMTDAVVETYAKHRLDCLVCIGGGGTQKNALRLQKAGLNVITLPKTIDNDVAETDVTFGFDTAMEIGTEAIDRLHSTATSHNRIIVVELMGHRAGWLALGAGMAGGADVILIPEIPYDLEKVAAAITARSQAGKHFSIVAVAEGAMSREQHAARAERCCASARRRRTRTTGARSPRSSTSSTSATPRTRSSSSQQLESLTGQESRLTILGHLLRGGTPSATDRVLATRVGTAAAEMVENKCYGMMAAVRGERDRAGSARRRGRQEEARAEGPPLAGRGAARGYLLRRLTGATCTRSKLSAMGDARPRRTRSATPASTRALLRGVNAAGAALGWIGLDLPSLDPDAIARAALPPRRARRLRRPGLARGARGAVPRARARGRTSPRSAGSRCAG